MGALSVAGRVVPCELILLWALVWDSLARFRYLTMSWVLLACSAALSQYHYRLIATSSVLSKVSDFPQLKSQASRRYRLQSTCIPQHVVCESRMGTCLQRAFHMMAVNMIQGVRATGWRMLGFGGDQPPAPHRGDVAVGDGS